MRVTKKLEWPRRADGGKRLEKSISAFHRGQRTQAGRSRGAQGHAEPQNMKIAHAPDGRA
jgi:hypothetical protein